MRIRSLDLARGFTVLCIPAVHTVLLYSQPAVRDTLPGGLLRFIAEGPGAALLMTYMGISMTLSEGLTWTAVWKRSFQLVIAGYWLNCWKFVLPLQLGLLPAAFQTDLGITNPCTAAETVFLIGDIFHFAALAYPVTFAVYCLRRYWIYAIAAASGVLLLAPLGWDRWSCSPVTNYVLTLVGGQPPAVFFPLLPWLVYPLAGLALGYWLKRDTPDRFLFMGLTGVLLILLGELGHYLDSPSISFYRTRPADTLVHLGIVGVWLWIWEGVATYIKPNAGFRLLSLASRHITLLYGIQWPLICWGLPLFGYQHLTFWPSIMVAAAMTVLTLFLSLLILASTHEGISIEE